MSRTILGGLLGGGAATVYLRPDIVADFAKDKAVQGLLSSRSYASTAGNSREIEQLAKLVEQLAKDVQNSKQAVTIVHTNPGSRAGSWVLTGAAVAGMGTIVYLKFVRGWGLSDFFYVTRRSLKQGLETVGKGLEEVRGRLDAVKAALQEKIGVLMRKQDATMAAQREMQGRLDSVGDDVETIRGQVGQIHGLVLDVSSGLQEVGANQRHANQGIFILCKAVSELMQGSDIPSRKELIDYTQHPIWTADKLQGLEGILCRISDNTEPQQRRAGALLLENGGSGSCGALPAYAPGAVEPVYYGLEPNGVGEPVGGGANGAFGYGGVEPPPPPPPRRLQQSSSFSFPGAGAGGGPANLGRASPPFGGFGGGGGGGIIATGVAAARAQASSDPF